MAEVLVHELLLPGDSSRLAVRRFGRLVLPSPDAHRTDYWGARVVAPSCTVGGSVGRDSRGDVFRNKCACVGDRSRRVHRPRYHNQHRCPHSLPAHHFTSLELRLHDYVTPIPFAGSALCLPHTQPRGLFAAQDHSADWSLRWKPPQIALAYLVPGCRRWLGTDRQNVGES